METEMINAMLIEARQQVGAARGDNTANWLLSDYADHLWITRCRGREKVVDDLWRGTVNVNWGVHLPNGKLLTDIAYENLLGSLKRCAFSVRSGITGKQYSSMKWLAFVRSLLSFTSWVVLHEHKFCPEKYGFNAIDQRGLNKLFDVLATGGWCAALNVPATMLRHIELDLFGNTRGFDYEDESVLKMSESSGKMIIGWLEDQGCYSRLNTGIYYGKRCLNLKKLSDLFFSSSVNNWSPKYCAFLRQFEPDFSFTTLLVSPSQSTEYPSQNVVTLEKALNSRTAVKSLETFHGHLNVMKDFELVNWASEGKYLAFAASPRISYRRCRLMAAPKTRTNFIPVEIGISYLNHAMRWVTLYGDALIDYYSAWLQFIDLADYERSGSTRRETIIRKAREKLDLMSEGYSQRLDVDLSELFDLKVLLRGGVRKTHDQIRSRPTVLEALNVLIGACIVVIGILKPSRITELTYLTADCLVHKEDGFYLKFRLGKSNVLDSYQLVEKPIPDISAKAIQLLQKLGSVVNKNSFPKYITKQDLNLFHLPMGALGRPLSLEKALLDPFLDCFCDHVNLPLRENSTRWYIRIHEMRKWFLLLLFWAGRYDVLDATRWIAGHTDASHIYTYIQHEFPGEELPKLEANYAMERLVDLETNPGHVKKADQGLSKLYKKVLRHFNASALSVIPEVEWERYVMELRKHEDFYLEPCSIKATNANEISHVEVSFVLRS
jgi:hypothetical protein